MTEYRAEIETKTTITIDIETAAKWFANLSDEQQADFFVAVAAEAEKWPPASLPRNYQWYLVGRHLRTCSCSTEEARELIQSLHEGLENG